MIREPSVEAEKRLGSATRTPGVRAASWGEGPAIERQVDNTLAAYNLAQSCIFGLQKRRGSVDFHSFGYLAHLHRKIEPRLLVDLDRQIARSRRTEAFGIYLNRVFAGHKIADLVLTIRSRRYQTSDTGSRVGDGHRSSGDDCAGRICNQTQYSRVERLSSEAIDYGGCKEYRQNPFHERSPCLC